MEGQGDIFQSQAKKKLLEKLLRGEFALVYINPGMDGLKLPPQTGGAPSVTLKLSNNFMGSLLLKSQEIEAELLFGDKYEKCVIPYSAIWAVGDTVDVVRTWKEAIPPIIKPFLTQLGLTPEGDVAKNKRIKNPTASTQETIPKRKKTSSSKKANPLSLASESSPPTQTDPNPPKPGLRRIK